MAGSFSLLSHTADTGVEVIADSRGELFEWAARAMFATTYGTESLEPERWLTVAAKDPRIDDMLVDLLADLLYISEVEDVVPCDFRVTTLEPTEVGMEVGVAAATPEMLVGPPIKAVTYHGLEVEELADGRWRARVVFDV